MPGLSDQILSALKAEFRPAHLELTDDSALHASHQGPAQSGGGHFKLVIVSDAFERQKPLERHRSVYRVLAPWMSRDIHALQLEVLTPHEWQKKTHA